MKKDTRPLTIRDIKNKVYKIQTLSIAQEEYIQSLLELAYHLGYEKGKNEK